MPADAFCSARWSHCSAQRCHSNCSHMLRRNQLFRVIMGMGCHFFHGILIRYSIATAHRCTSLRAIDLSGSHLLVTDELLDTIAGCCGTLRELRLNYCENFSALGLQVRWLGRSGRGTYLALAIKHC